MRRWHSERGTALVESAIAIPLLLLIAAGIFEFGRAYQTWQVLTNAAREGARVAVLPNGASTTAVTRVRQYMQTGQLPKHATAPVNVDRAVPIMVNGMPQTASEVVIDYPFTFVALQPLARLVDPSATAGSPLTMQARALMRNEAQ